MGSNNTSNNPLAYLGIDRFEQPRFIYASRAPLIGDNLVPGTQWFDRLTTKIYISRGSGIWQDLTTTANDSAITWNDNATTTTANANNGYIVTSGNQVITLPTVSKVGDVIEVVLHGGDTWQIAHAPGQSVIINGVTTTAGPGGSITTTDSGQTIKLTCIVANTKWQTTGLVGNPTVV